MPLNANEPEQRRGFNFDKSKDILARVKHRGALTVSALALAAMLGAAYFEAIPAGVAGEQSQAQSVAPMALEQRLPSFAPLVDRVKAAVVSIRVKSNLGKASGMDWRGPFGQDNNQDPFEGTPFERFFKGPNAPFHFRGPLPHGRLVTAQGSGFFISPDGYIVTNNHVAGDAVSMEIVTDDGRTYTAKTIGADPKTDLALLKVDGRDDFPYVKLSHTDARVGDWVVAMGNPFGLGGTVTAGIVSARGRDIGEGPYDDFLQIDAPVNKGNSGGPAFNQDGEVLGVNTAIYSPSGGSVGIAFAIPASTVEQVVAQLKEHGHVTRGWLGVQIQNVTPQLADSLGLKETRGALVAASQSGGPAEKAGLKPGDVIVEVNGEPVKDAHGLARKIAGIAPEADVTLTFMRAGEKQTLSLKIGELTEKAAQNAAAEPETKSGLNGLGIEVAPASEATGSDTPGLAVLSVDPGSKAAEAGLSEGDIILQVGSTDVSRADDLKRALRAAEESGKKHVLALVKRQNAQHYIALPTKVS